MKELLEKIWEKWKNEEDAKAQEAYTYCYFAVLEYINEKD